jgi:glycerol-3-phosphate acyltransferase PlsX
MLPIAVDAMGGDRAPAAIVEGAVRAASDLGIPVILVGQPEVLADLDTGGLEILPASEVIAMTDDPAHGVRRKKDSSLVRAAEAVRDGKASAMVSAGNTGATMASALLRFGRLPNVTRPAIATAIPVPGGFTPTVLLDAGANSECTAPMLVQFAQMGATFSHQRFGIESPRVGLLSIGEEPGKGSPLVKETWSLLDQLTGINFIGNVEGRDVMTDDVDVVVTDGFTGNVVLKTLEGGMRTLQKALIEILMGTEEAAAASAPLMPGFLALAAELDPETYGGAMLLGVNGVCIISHGSSSARAIANALGVARDLVEADVVGQLRSAVAH